MRGSRAVLLFNYSRDNNCTALRPYLLEKGRLKGVFKKVFIYLRKVYSVENCRGFKFL
jgi:hypothetical protein